MDKYVSGLIHRYFRKLSTVGYANDDELMKLLAVVAIFDFTSRDYSGFLSFCDYKIIERALYNLVGGCELPYPQANNTLSIMNKLHLGDLSLLANRVNSMNEYVLAYSENNTEKQKQQDDRLDVLEDQHDIPHPEYDEDPEVEYGAKMKKRDAAHAGRPQRRKPKPHCTTKYGEHFHRPEPYEYRYDKPDCPCKNLRWR